MSTETEIDPRASVSRRAALGMGVRVGPFAVVEAGVEIGDGCLLAAHAVVYGGTRLGPRNEVHSFCVLGGPPQDRTYQGEPTRLEVGAGNVFREHATAHRGTARGGGVTRVGDEGLFMAGAHVGHDASVGARVTLGHGTLLGGHVHVGDDAVTGGHVAVAPLVRVGRLAFLAGGAILERDVPPFVIAAGDRARVRALNAVGLRRSAIDAAGQLALKEAFRRIYGRGETVRGGARALLDEEGAHPLARELAEAVLRDARRLG